MFRKQYLILFMKSNGHFTITTKHPVSPFLSPQSALSYHCHFYAEASFMRLRADPALNHSICCSLKVWFNLMSSLEPSECFNVATT